MPGATLAGLDFLDKPPAAIPAVCVVFGDEAFLKRESLDHLRDAVLGAEDADFSFSEFNGEEVEVHEVFDCLSTVALIWRRPAAGGRA